MSCKKNEIVELILTIKLLLRDICRRNKELETRNLRIAPCCNM